MKILINAGADVNLQTKFGKRPLHYVRYHQDGMAEIARLLLDAGSEVNARDRFNETALHEVDYRRIDDAVDNSKIIFTLIARGAEIDPQDVYGATPLRRAIIYGNALHTEILVSLGASVEKAKYSNQKVYTKFEEMMEDDVIIAAIALGKSPMGEKWKKELQKYY